MDTTPSSSAVRVVILGGGFAGVYTARWLQKLAQPNRFDVTLISRDNYFLMTPLLFEAGSGVLEPRHAVNPIRPLFQSVRFVEAEVKSVDLALRKVHIDPSHNEEISVDFDHLVLALGGITSLTLVPGSEHALTFKNLGDAIFLRNHVIAVLERADVETDPQRKKAALSFIIVGGGLVAVELAGELTTFLGSAIKFYSNLRLEDVRFEMIEAGPRIAAEFDPTLADYAARTLEARSVKIRNKTRVERIDRGVVHLPGGEKLEADTIILATGVSTNPLVAALPIEKDKKQRAVTDAMMRVKNADRIWALGDCAAIPDPTGKPYPALAQHAIREARVLAENIIATTEQRDPESFVYHTQGTLAALGHFKGIGTVKGIKIRGLLAWWVWRSYYLFQMPLWSRRVRIVIDWTIALFFKNDIVKLDFSRGAAATSPSEPEVSKTEQ